MTSTNKRTAILLLHNCSDDFTASFFLFHTCSDSWLCSYCFFFRFYSTLTSCSPSQSSFGSPDSKGLALCKCQSWWQTNMNPQDIWNQSTQIVSENNIYDANIQLLKPSFYMICQHFQKEKQHLQITISPFLAFSDFFLIHRRTSSFLVAVQRLVLLEKKQLVLLRPVWCWSCSEDSRTGAGTMLATLIIVRSWGINLYTPEI